MMKLIRNRIFIVILCTAATVALILYIMPQYARMTNEHIKVIRVSRTIAAGECMTDDMLKVVEVGKYNLPGNIIKTKKEIVGKYAALELIPSDNLSPEKFTNRSGLADSFLYNMDGETAVSISVKSLAAGLSGKLLPGDVVSVLAYEKPDDSQGKGYVREYPDLEFVEVGAISNNKAQDTGELKAKKEEDKTYQDTIIPSTITLKVTKEQAKQLVEIENTAAVHLVFRGRGDNARKLLKKEGR